MQSKRHSFFEVATSVALGFGLSYSILFLVPAIHRFLPLWATNLTITVIMTAVSFARQYSVRRFFNRVKG